MKKSMARYLYGIGLIAAAVGFAIPMVDIWILGSYNGFKIAGILGTFNSIAEYCLYVFYAAVCIGAVCAFIPKLRAVDFCSLGVMAASIIVLVFQFAGKTGAKNAGGKMPSELTKFFTNLAFDVFEPGLYVFVAGIILSIVAFILTFSVKKHK